MNVIDDFKKVEFLSNFSNSPIRIGGKFYLTVEHFYQAMKATNEVDHEYVRSAETPGIAKKRGKAINIVPEWELVKDSVMELALRHKFALPTMKAKLLSTGDAELIEGNWWGDTYWGMCKGVGQNHLGKLLMKLRNEYLISEEPISA